MSCKNRSLLFPFKLKAFLTIIGVSIGFVCLSTPRSFTGPQAPPHHTICIYSYIKVAPDCQKSSTSYKFNSLNFDSEKISVITVWNHLKFKSCFRRHSSDDCDAPSPDILCQFMSHLNVTHLLHPDKLTYPFIIYYLRSCEVIR